MNVFTYWRGRLRLWHCYCPACNSSPPLPECGICHGDRNYGPGTNAGKLAIWRGGWDRLRAGQ